jgi:serine protease inhibitor
MVTELTAGESRGQILGLLGAPDIDVLRQQVGAIWESTYTDNGHEISTLANSLWLEEGLRYQQDTMDSLAYHYYASVYQGDLGSQKINDSITAWINNHTGGFLKNATKNIQLSPETILALYSTIYFQAKWQDEFSKMNNTKDVFHTPNGDKTVTFMNKDLAQMYYYWGDRFGAVALSLKNGSRMWFVLPDEGYTPSDVLADGQYMQMVLQQDWENEKWMKVNLSVPKFDVNSTVDIKAGLQKMGVTDVFAEDRANFSELTGDVPIFLTAANQSVRVQIDEEGVKAAAYIEIPGAMSPAPPEEIIDFVLDRPFVFAITTDSIPLFVGTVNAP